MKGWSLMCEVSESEDKPVDQETIVEDVIQVPLSIFENCMYLFICWCFRVL